MFISCPFKEAGKSIIRTSLTRALFTAASDGHIRDKLGRVVQRGRQHYVSGKPRPKPARRAKSPFEIFPVDEYLPPIAILKLAKKSTLLEIEPDAALNLLRRYIQLQVKKELGWEKKFCKEENITPHTLTILSHILSNYRKAAPKILATSLILSASSLGDPAATISILGFALQNGTLQDTEYIAPLAHLKSLVAPPKPNTEAMVLLGRIYYSQGKKDAALKMFERAASNFPSSAGPATESSITSPGVAEALIAQGQILQQRSDRSGAESAFRKAALDHDNPSGYFHLAQLQEPDLSTREVYLLKAASSGIIEACHELGKLQFGKLGAEPEITRGGKSRYAEMAKEWLYLSATAGNGESMILLASVFIDEGKLQSGFKWLAKAEDVPDVAEKASRLKHQWSEPVRSRS